MSQHQYDLTNLREHAEAAVADVREMHEEPLPELLSQTTHDARGDADTVTGEEFDQLLDGLFDELDELYGVETDEGLRSYMGRRTGYDWSRAEHMKRTGRNSILAGSMVAAVGKGHDQQVFEHATEAIQQEPVLGAVGLGLSAAGVMAVDKVTKRLGTATFVEIPYPVIDHKHRDINISPDQEPAGFTYPTTVSEITHAYQDLRNSPSFQDPVYEEGLDVGAQLAVGERNDDDPVWEQDNSWRRLFVLGYAYAERASEEGIEPERLEEIGYTEQEAEEAVSVYEEHPSLRKDPNAVLGAAGLYVAAQEEGYDVYEDVFHGDYDSVPDWVPFHGDS